MKQIDLLLTGIGSLYTPEGTQPRYGEEMGRIRETTGAAVAIEQGRIALAGKEDEVIATLAGIHIAETIDAGGRMVTPGLVDPHTHLVHAGSREHELAMKRSGVPYLDILAQGGGILSTVKSTRTASEQELYDKAGRSLDEMLLQGVTTIEAKSGYGLSLETELKQLRVSRRLHDTHPVDVVSTFMGAHAVPEEYKGRSDDFVDLVIRDMLPAVAEEGLAEFCDVFCEEGVFNVEQSRRILEEGKRFGLQPKIHADEIVPLGGSDLAGEVGAVSAEHLLTTTDQGLSSLAAGNVVPVLLPGTSFNLGLSHHARARDMIDKFRLPVALSTDYNPGSCPTESIQLIIMLASLNLKMTPEEILTACTLNAAAAIGRAGDIGSIEPGKRADLTIFDAPNLAYLPYHFGINHTFGVIKNGTPVAWNRTLTEKGGIAR
ncbi:imidazolonepropionase [Paenibacillus apiarius]|uniref:Imidazolonepropionase n=1 Tax=Paenibacillus apiarius TaxID=46240 RepID=A0ABT4DQG7_9BACL|nr:imidazolonepropionase [Paenibacillus apiarius]MCY9513432.1 imidazolonepropionase [Paenibacillus apiarius]MCY9519595.1 imidazolonepropionase [Paenibacillus apiarius]MCY9553348.1 imidazolonepropionase [Paenibacillus apiarius]MCY9557198.1 imidazolonepropionase [Paenibacillus apiarius]MCY9682061.1 imidazolonepropionase [Paenibacillus apiarius]